MTTIFYSDTANPQKELSAEWFADFNWQNFQHGEIVWLEDNDETAQPAARFLGQGNGNVFLSGVDYATAQREHRVR
jgi:hypothetical protein